MTIPWVIPRIPDPQPAQQEATTQMQEQANSVSEYQQTESTLMTILPYLPDRDTWPDPLQKMFMLFTIENTVNERTAGMEWTALPDIPTAMQQALVAIEDHDFYRHGAVDMGGILRATFVNILPAKLYREAAHLRSSLPKICF